jgi:hypothetical protein
MDDAANDPRLGLRAAGTLAVALVAAVPPAISQLPIRQLAWVLAVVLLAVVTYLIRYAMDRRGERRARQDRRDRVGELLALWPLPTAADVDPVALGIGEWSDGLSEDPRAVRYEARPVDDVLRTAVANGKIVVVLGARGSGKSRSALEALRADDQLGAAGLVVPADAAALRDLLAARADAVRPDARYVLWLDDLDRFLGGLRLRDLDRLIASDRVTVVGTLEDGAADAVLAGGGDRAHVLRGLMARADRVTMPGRTSDEERRHPWLCSGPSAYRPGLEAEPAPSDKPPAVALWAMALGVILTAGLAFYAFNVGLFKPATLNDRFAEIEAQSDDCGGVGLSPHSADGVRSDLVVVHHQSDVGCRRSDLIEVFARRDGTLTKHPALSVQPPASPKEQARCIGPDGRDPCHVEIQGLQRVIIVALRNATTGHWIPVAIRPSKGGYAVQPVPLPPRSRDATTQPADLQLQDMRREGGAGATIAARSVAAVAVTRPRQFHGAVLLVGYTKVVNGGRRTLELAGVELRVNRGVLQAGAACRATQPGTSSPWTFDVTDQDNLVVRLQREWRKASRLSVASCEPA